MTHDADAGGGMVIDKSTIYLDSNVLLMEITRYADGICRVDVVFQLSPSLRTTVMTQFRPSQELAVAAIARDFSTYAARALAALPTINHLEDPYDPDAPKDV